MEFFNKISEKASTAYKVTAAKTGKLAKEAKLKLKMSNLKSQINDIYLDIGAKIYEKHLLKEDINIKNDLEEECTKIDILTNQIEEAGIIVTFNGIVGTNTRRVIDVNECRGFVLVNNKAPFLFINSADAKAAQMFTLIHELAHVWLGESAGFDNQNLIPANDPVEILCDKVAAEFLVPEIIFMNKWEVTKDFKYLSRIFKVSQIVIARRALDLNLITKTSFLEFYNKYMGDFKFKKDNQGSGGNFYATARKRVSLRFASFVNNAVKENRLLYRDAYKLTNLKGETYNKFITEYLY